jgi:hypothetical protein
MGDGKQKSLIILIVISILLGIGVIFYKNNYSELPFTVEQNLMTNKSYYPNIESLEQNSEN